MSFEVDILPENTRVPGVYIGVDTTGALNGVQVGQQSMCIVSQKTDSGNAEYNRAYDIASERRAIALFGRGSPAHVMYRNAVRQNKFGNYRVAVVDEERAVPVNNGDSWKLEIEGTATAGGRIRAVFYVQDKNEPHTEVFMREISIAVAAGTTAQNAREAFWNARDALQGISIWATGNFSYFSAGTTYSSPVIRIDIHNSVAGFGVFLNSTWIRPADPDEVDYLYPGFINSVQDFFPGGAKKSGGSVVVRGAAADSGSVSLTIGQEVVRINAVKGDSGAQIAAKLFAALSSPSLLLEAAVSVDEANLAKLNFTALAAGEYGNSIGIEFGAAVGGISAAVNDMSGGYAGRNFSNLFEHLAGQRNDIIVFPFDWTTQNNAVVDFVDKVSSPEEKNPAICVIGKKGEIFDVATISKPNHHRFVFANLIDTNATLGAALSALGAQILYRRDPAVPLDNDKLPGIRAGAFAVDYLRNELDYLLSNGITTLHITSGGNFAITRLVSTQIDGVGERVADVWVRVVDFVAEAVRNSVSDAIRNQKNSERVRLAIWGVVYMTLLDLQDLEIVKNVEAHKDSLIVERMPENIGFLRIKIPADIVLGLHGVMGHINLIIS